MRDSSLIGVTKASDARKRRAEAPVKSELSAKRSRAENAFGQMFPHDASESIKAEPADRGEDLHVLMFACVHSTHVH